jgi:hypothetical protein
VKNISYHRVANSDPQHIHPVLRTSQKLGWGVFFNPSHLPRCAARRSWSQYIPRFTKHIIRIIYIYYLLYIYLLILNTFWKTLVKSGVFLGNGVLRPHVFCEHMIFCCWGRDHGSQRESSISKDRNHCYPYPVKKVIPVTAW